MYRFLLLTTTLFTVFVSQAMGQISLFPKPIPSFPKSTSQDIRLDATIQNRMSTEEYLLRIAQIKQAQNQANAEDRREAAKLGIIQTQSLYNSLNMRPFSINNGWYNITFTNETPSCGTRKVYVENGRIKRWIMSNGVDEVNVVFSSPIEKGKAMVRTENDGRESDFISVYFLENLMDSGARASAPEIGNVTFWTNYKKLKGKVEIYIEGQLIGELNNYFDSQPSCQQEEGIVTFTWKPGVYNFVAKSINLTWNGTVEIANGRCALQCLSKK